jgi:hypothetical protein
LVSGNSPVKDIRSEVSSVRPNYSAEFRIDTDLGEIGRVAERLENAVETEMRFEVNFTL